MILSIDIGNSNICFAAHEKNATPLFFERVHTGRDLDTSYYADVLSSILKMHALTGADFEGGILSSVVSSLTNVLSSAAKIVLGKELLVVSSACKLPMELHVKEPQTVGADILCDIAGALTMGNGPFVTFDMGTATVASYISKENALESVFILPGVRTALSSLSKNTSSLPDIALDQPRNVIGKNTIESLQSGILYGTAGLVDGIVKQIEKEAGSTCRVILTGGLSSFIAPYCTHELTVEPALLMKGLYEIFQLNQ